MHSSTNEIKIRGVSPQIKTKLQELSTQYGFPSLNRYLVYTLTKFVESEGLTSAEKLVIESQNEVARALEKNTEVILLALEFLYRKREEKG